MRRRSRRWPGRPVLRKNRGRGGGFRGGGAGRRGMSVGRGGGELNIFFRARNAHQVKGADCPKPLVL